MSSQPVYVENGGRLFELFKMAVQEERKAQEVYGRALSLCTDPALRPVLQEIIDDEARHERILIDRYNALAARHPAFLKRDSSPKYVVADTSQE